MDHFDAKANLKETQGVNRDMRRNVREANDFVNKRDGQWESDIIRRFKGKPRYTDDRVNPIVNQVCGELGDAEFTLRARPAGGEATQGKAKVIDGLIRTIRNMSKEKQITTQVARNVVEGGFDAYLLEHDYVNDNSFDQDILIRPIHDAVDRVWLDSNDLSQDGSDAQWGVVLHYMSKEDYKEQFPRGACKSLSTGRNWNRYYHKAKTVVVGDYYYLKEKTVILNQMSNGDVYEDNEDFQKVVDELIRQGIEIEDTRKRRVKTCYVRTMDANGWLTDEEELVWDCIPIIPAYANFKVVEGKIIYRGIVEKLMDIQRVHNYAFSRDVEEVALSPRKKYWMTEAQADGHEEEIRTMNTNTDPVQFYNPDPNPNVPPPYYAGGGEVNGAVRMLVDSTDQGINRAAGMFGANMGDVQHLQSGVAIEQQIDRGNNGTAAYFEALEVAMTRMGDIIIRAIPKVYDATRKIRILNEDNSYEMAIMNQVVVDEQTGQEVTLNDLTCGQYDIVCDIGPAYKNRQKEAGEMFLRAAEKNPDLLGIGSDLWVKNINAPGFDLLAERLRTLAVNNGVVPDQQLTEEELQAVQAARAQPPQPGPEELALQVQMMEAQTAQMAEQNKGVEHQIKMQELQVRAAQEQEKTQSKLAVDSARINQNQQKIDLSAQQQEFNQMMEQMKLQIQAQQQALTSQLEEIKTFATVMKNVKDSMGVDAIVSQEAVEAYQTAADQLGDGMEGEQ
jgi:hypothetical protein